MAAALTLLLIGCLLQSALCGQFNVTMPQTIKVLRGSCVTIPCSFDIEDTYKAELDNTCKALWKTDASRTVFDSSNPLSKTISGKLTGDLTKKDCTTILNNMQPEHSNSYYFRVECNNKLKYDFRTQILKISVTDDPPRPTLTPSTLEVKEGTSVNVTCSAPAPCSSHPPTLTWTPGLGDSQETLQENRDKTKVKTSVLTFTASHLHHKKEISCTAAYKQDGGTESSVSTSLTADITHSPKHTTVSVFPSGPVPEYSSVTLTCSSSANPAVRNYTWYRADGGQKTSIGTGHVLSITASKVRGPFFCEAGNVLGAGRSINSQIDVQFAPQILPSSVCTKTAGQLSCSCETMGNPFPTLQWYLELSVNHTDKFAISNDTGVSLFTLSLPQERAFAILRCNSSNSLGSATQRFYVYILEPQPHAHVMLPVFITTVAGFLVLVCALLLVIRAQKTHHNLPNSKVAMSQLLTSGEENEVPNTTEEDIYVNVDVLRQEHVAHPATISEPNSTILPSPAPNHAEGASKSSEKKNEEGSDVIYSSVHCKSKKKKKKEDDSVGMDQPTSSYVEEEGYRNVVSNALEMGSIYDEVEPRNVKEKVKVECEYAQVTFKNKSVMLK